MAVMPTFAGGRHTRQTSDRRPRSFHPPEDPPDIVDVAFVTVLLQRPTTKNADMLA